MRPGYVRSAVAQPTRPTWRQRALSAFLSAAIIFLLSLLLFTRTLLPALPASEPVALPTEFILMPSPPPPVEADPPPNLKPKLNSGGSPKAAGPPNLLRPLAKSSGASPDPTIETPLKLDEVPLVASTPSLLPMTDIGTALADQGSGDGRGDFGAGVNGRGGVGRGRGKGVGDGDADGLSIVAARWVWRPTERDLAPFVPEAARRARKSGTVYLACQVLESRRVRDCRVLAEQPAGLGFGVASLAASRIFRIHPERKNGRIVADVWVGIPITWSFKP